MHALGRRQSEKIRPLPHKNNDTYASGEAGNHRRGNELDHPAQAQRAHQRQHHPRQERGNLQAGDAVRGGDTAQDGDKGASGPGNLYAAAAQNAHQNTGHDSGVNTLLWPRARGDGKGHGQG